MTRLDQSAPGLGPADAVDVETARLLEATDRPFGEPAVLTIDASGIEPGAQQPPLEIADVGALRANSEGP
jgi:hypothetical protein